MFNAKVKSIDDKRTRCSIIVYTDTLYEAECYLRALIGTWYNSRHIKLVYEHDTIYSIYDCEVLVGELQILLGD